jgi:hypothetical protein
LEAFHGTGTETETETENERNREMESDVDGGGGDDGEGALSRSVMRADVGIVRVRARTRLLRKCRMDHLQSGLVVGLDVRMVVDEGIVVVVGRMNKGEIGRYIVAPGWTMAHEEQEVAVDIVIEVGDGWSIVAVIQYVLAMAAGTQAAPNILASDPAKTQADYDSKAGFTAVPDGHKADIAVVPRQDNLL